VSLYPNTPTSPSHVLLSTPPGNTRNLPSTIVESPRKFFLSARRMTRVTKNHSCWSQATRSDPIKINLGAELSHRILAATGMSPERRKRYRRHARQPRSISARDRAAMHGSGACNSGNANPLQPALTCPIIPTETAKMSKGFRSILK